MQLIRLVAVAIAVVIAAAGYIHEGRRLRTIRDLPGDKARDLYEAGRTRDERVMWVVAVLLAGGAVVAVAKLLSMSPAGVSGG